jgi:hypothetical protein
MKRILFITLIVLILSVLVDLLFYSGHGFAWSNILGFFALFGFIGCIAIILISKWLGHHWLQRKEDYYDRKNSDE